MFKKLKIKKTVSLLLVFLLSLNSFITYATSNDGSSFITKAEFDSLKNTFQSQLDAYNTSIDSKIESAISAYLKGVVSDTTRNDQSNIDELLWPVTLLSKLECTKYIYPTTSLTDSLLRTSYKFYVCDLNRSYESNDFFEYNGSSMNDIWLGGHWKSSKFYVSGYNSEPLLTITGMGIADHWGNSATSGSMDLGTSALCLDWKYAARTNQAVWDSPCANKSRSAVNSGQAMTLLNEGEIRGLINETDFTTLKGILLGFTRGDFKTYLGWTAGANVDKWPSTGTGRVLTRRVPYDTNMYLNWSFNTTYNKGIRYIYNISDTEVATTDAKYFVAPTVANDGKDLYVTNIKNSRVVYKNATRSPNLSMIWNKSDHISDTYRDKYGIMGVLTAGLNIESPYNAISGHTYDSNYSAVKTSDLRYDFKNANGSSVTQNMVSGIPLYSFDDNYPDGFKEFSVTINIKSESTATTSNQKYICFSKAPVTKSNYVSGEESYFASNTDLLEIKKGGDGEITGTNKKLYKLKEGDNTFDFEKMPAMNIGDTLYFKIYFADSEKYINVDQPKLAYRF